MKSSFKTHWFPKVERAALLPYLLWLLTYVIILQILKLNQHINIVYKILELIVC